MTTIAFGWPIFSFMAGFAIIVSKEFTDFPTKDFQCAMAIIAVFGSTH